MILNSRNNSFDFRFPTLELFENIFSNSDSEEEEEEVEG